MALAMRRLLLRSNAFNYTRPDLSIRRLPSRAPPSSRRRQFHLSTIRLKDEKSGNPQSDPALSPDTKEVASAAGDAPSPLDAASREWVQEFYQRIERNGDIGSVLDMLDDDALSDDERDEVLSMVNQLEGLDAKEAHYKDLVDAIISAPKDPAALDEILKNMGQDPKELLDGLTDEEKAKFDESGADPEDPFDVERTAMEALDEAYRAGNMPTVEQVQNLGNVDAKALIEQSKRGEQLSGEMGDTMSADERQNMKKLWARDDRIEKMFGVHNDPDMEKERDVEGFWNYGEGDEDLGEDEEFQGDDITAKGHAELEQHREMREYARLAVWELPLLHKLARPFEPPTKEQFLRFRYTTYMGEEHPAASKVVLEVSPEDLGLTDIEKSKLIKLAGVRYNPSTKIIKMACESFETQAQNKRYLGDLVEVLIRNAKDPRDTFEDVPFDFRHHKPKQFYEFPEEWKLTPARKKALDERRAARLEKEGKRVAEGKILDGLLLTPGGRDERRRSDVFREEQVRLLENAEINEYGHKVPVPVIPELILDGRARAKGRVGLGRRR